MISEVTTLDDFDATRLDGTLVHLFEYAGRVVLVVNTASRCGLTPQYEELQELYARFHQRGFTILAFPCNQFAQQEPGTRNQIQALCVLQYGVTFPIFDKVNVKGKHIHPLYEWLTREKPTFLGPHIRWNFTKFLIDRDGRPHSRYLPITKPAKLADTIDRLLG